MLYRKGNLIPHGVRSIRWIHSTRCYRSNNPSDLRNVPLPPIKDSVTEDKEDNNTTNNHIHDTSIQERMLFNKVFESMEQKKGEKQEFSSDILQQFPKPTKTEIKDPESLPDPNNECDLKVSFGKYDGLKDFYDGSDQEPFTFEDSSIQSLMSEFQTQKKPEKKVKKQDKNYNEKQINKDDEVLPIFKFLDGIEHELSQIKKKTLESNMTIPDSINKLHTTQMNNNPTELTQTLKDKMSTSQKERVIKEERFKFELTNCLTPYLTYLHDAKIIESDYDMLQYIKEQILSTYMQRDRTNSRSSFLKLPPKEIITHIKTNLEKNPKNIPEPYEITMPCILLQLLSDEKQWGLPDQRRYQLITYVYQQIRTCPDITMYLYFGTVEFYNLLIDLTWINTKDVSRIKTILNEMQNNGIPGDLTTLETVSKVITTMRSLNEDIMDESAWQAIKSKPLILGLLWSRDTESDILSLERYLKRLKRQLTQN